MRILHVIQELRTGGAERISITLAEGSLAAGHDVAVAAADGPLADEFPGERFPVGMIRRRPTAVPAAVRAVGRAIAEWRPDVVHAHNPGMALAAGIATRRGRRPPGLVSVHGVPERDWRRAARIVRLSGLAPVACGPGVAEALAAAGAPAAATVWNAVAPSPPPADRAALERELSIPAGAPLVVAAGRLVAAKNHRLAIEALCDVDDATLAILGEGPLRAELERAASEAGVRDRVVFAGLRDDARAIIGAADAVVLTSHAEGLPLVALEALAAGTPLVATSVRGLRELVEDGRSALLVPAGDATALADRLRRVLGDRALAQTLATGGRDVAAAHSVDAMVGGYLSLYERLAA